MHTSNLIIGMLVFAAIAVWFMPLGIINQVLAFATCVVVAAIYINGSRTKKE